MKVVVAEPTVGSRDSGPRNARPGDVDARASVWEYEADLTRFARSLCGSAPDAEDVAQSSLVKAAEHLEGFRGEASIRTWLHRIVLNECRMLHRRPPPRSVEQILEARGTIEGEPIGLPDVVGPEESALASELQATVLRALRALPDEYRTVLLLADGKGGGLPVEEIARLVGGSVPAVRAKLHRARSMLRERLRPYWAE